VLFRSLKLNPNFDKALSERARLRMQEGDLDGAVEDYQVYYEGHKEEDVLQALENAKSAKEAWSKVGDGSCSSKMEHLNAVITHSPHHVDARMIRAACFFEGGELEMAAGDFIRSAKLRPDNTVALLTLSQIRLKLGETGECINSLKECLKFDLDHKECKKLFRLVKKFEKEYAKLDAMFTGQSFATVIKTIATRPNNNLISQADSLSIGGGVKGKLYEYVCRSYASLNDAVNAKIWCEKTLEIDENNVEALLILAGAKIDREEYEEAVNMYKKAHDNGGDRRANEGFNRAQRLLKQAGQKNYYKVLGVSRDASTRDIKKAFRKLAQRWHPDKVPDSEKEIATKKMGEINEAYDVLKDDELRSRFDNGDDPNSQGESGFHQGFQQGNPFGSGGGFHGFQQGGFHFQF